MELPYKIQLFFMFFGMFSFSVLVFSYFFFKVENLILWATKYKTYKKITFRSWLGHRLASKKRPSKNPNPPNKKTDTATVVQLGRSKAV